MKPATVLPACFAGLLSLFFLFSCGNRPAPAEPPADPFADLPFQFPPLIFRGGMDAPGPSTPVLEDSLFLVRFVHPGYFQEEERQYRYYQGTVVMKTAAFVAVVYPLFRGAGFDYLLYTYTPAGQRLDTLTLAETAGNRYAQNAELTAGGLIRTERVYLDGSAPVHRQAFAIRPDGQIEPELPEVPLGGKETHGNPDGEDRK